MRARLFALLILIFLIGLPLLGYWYFFMKKVSGLSIEVVGVPSFSVHLEGALQNDALPLADQLIKFDKTCSGLCEFRPIAPIHYKATITSSGMITVHDTIDVVPGAFVPRRYTMTPDITMTPIERGYQDTEKEGLALVVIANRQNKGYTYTNLHSFASGSTVALRESESTREVGELTQSGFTLLWKVPKGAGDLILDITGEYFVVPLYTDSTLIVSRDFQREKEVKLRGIIGYVPGKEEKFLTESGILMSYRGSYGENPRFTDWIDLSPTKRLGYIAADDTTRLTLSNFPSGNSVLVLLDRTTGTSQVVRTGVDVRFFAYRNGKPISIDHAGGVSVITLGQD